MSLAESIEYQLVLDLIEAWPPKRRLALALRILEGLDWPRAGSPTRPNAETIRTLFPDSVWDWPRKQRLMLARELLNLDAPRAETPRRQMAEDIQALFRSDQPPPDDATVRHEIDEHRMEKYGR